MHLSDPNLPVPTAVQYCQLTMWPEWKFKMARGQSKCTLSKRPQYEHPCSPPYRPSIIHLYTPAAQHALCTHLCACRAHILNEPLPKCANSPQTVGTTPSYTVTNFIWTITLGILDWFWWSKWPPKALKKTFQTVPKTSQSNQYSPSYQQISWQSPSHQTLNHWYLRNCLM